MIFILFGDLQLSLCVKQQFERIQLEIIHQDN